MKPCVPPPYPDTPSVTPLPHPRTLSARAELPPDFHGDGGRERFTHAAGVAARRETSGRDGAHGRPAQRLSHSDRPGAYMHVILQCMFCAGQTGD